jgi:hypothetical protein
MDNRLYSFGTAHPFLRANGIKLNKKRIMGAYMSDYNNPNKEKCSESGNNATCAWGSTAM